MRKSNLNKTQSQRVHAKHRLLERFGMEINRHELAELVNQIKSNKSEHIETQSNRVSVHMVKFRGESLPVVYDKQRKNIVSRQF